MMIINIFIGPIVLFLLLAGAYSLVLGNISPKITRLFFRWAGIVIIFATLLKMFIRH